MSFIKHLTRVDKIEQPHIKAATKGATLIAAKEQ